MELPCYCRKIFENRLGNAWEAITLSSRTPVHEVLILPDNGIFQVPELNAMVQEVNETQVERQEQLSDKVQFCDKKTAVMENAERREARLEKEKAAEKAE